jgi:hypothetical protein
MYSNLMNTFEKDKDICQSLKYGMNSLIGCEISGSHGSKYEDDCLLAYSVV